MTATYRPSAPEEWGLQGYKPVIDPKDLEYDYPEFKAPKPPPPPVEVITEVPTPPVEWFRLVLWAFAELIILIVGGAVCLGFWASRAAHVQGVTAHGMGNTIGGGAAIAIVVCVFIMARGRG